MTHGRRTITFVPSPKPRLIPQTKKQVQGMASKGSERTLRYWRFSTRMWR